MNTNSMSYQTSFPGAPLGSMAGFGAALQRTTQRTTTTQQTSLLRGVAPGPPRVIHSSATLPWQGFLVERHACSPGERVAASTSYHVISLLGGRPAHYESMAPGGRAQVTVEPPGSITIIPAGRVPDIRLHSDAEFTHCALEDRFARGVLEELEPRPSGSPVYRLGVRDISIQRIMGLIGQELEADASTGRLYVESLAYALATRYFLSGGACEGKSKSHTSALPRRILNRVQEKIEASLDTDISLETLAEESGYSRAHFLRMFREATGVTPHQYVLDARLGRAQEWLRRKNSSLIDIAAFCGFSSQSHMTSVFRKRLGVTPGEFRRSGLEGRRSCKIPG